MYENCTKYVQSVCNDCTMFVSGCCPGLSNRYMVGLLRLMPVTTHPSILWYSGDVLWLQCVVDVVSVL